MGGTFHHARVRWAAKWIVAGVLLFLLLGAGRYLFTTANKEIEVQTVRVSAGQPGGSRGAPSGSVILNATGYIIAAHKIQLASKVVGKVAWIGVEKGDKIKEGQVLVRLEDDEYKAQLRQAAGPARHARGAARRAARMARGRRRSRGQGESRIGRRPIW